MEGRGQDQQLLPLVNGNFRRAQAFRVDMYQEEFMHGAIAPEAVLDTVVPNYMAGYIYGALVESYCSEQNARMVAMQAAT